MRVKQKPLKVSLAKIVISGYHQIVNLNLLKEY